jgi:hypothetical protein
MGHCGRPEETVSPARKRRKQRSIGITGLSLAGWSKPGTIDATDKTTFGSLRQL